MPPLLQDLYNQVQALQERLVPSGSYPGTRLTWVGPGENDTGWVADPDKEILRGHGDPNTVRRAQRGTLYIDVDTPTLWQNSTGGDVWVNVGGGGGSSTPTDWVEWFVSGTQTGFAYNSGFVTVDWDDSGSSGLTHGSAVILNASKDAEVTEDGWYCLDLYIEADADGSLAPWDTFDADLTVRRTFSIGGDTQDFATLIDDKPAENRNGTYLGITAFNWIGYLMNGDTVRVRCRFRANSDPSGDTWSITDGQFRMEKLPM